MSRQTSYCLASSWQCTVADWQGNNLQENLGIIRLDHTLLHARPRLSPQAYLQTVMSLSMDFFENLLQTVLLLVPR